MACVNQTVRVEQGTLRGLVQENVHGGQFLSFLGVPYAKPPTGPLRFKDPEPAEPWTGVREATKFGDTCGQFENITRSFKGSDDCLYLNVYAQPNETNTKRPVMVWIHGGAFIHGDGSTDYYGPDHLVRKDIVLVSINYRVGVLGFLNIDDEVASGNQGLKDQVMALKWVRENISSFGGDPENVTIFGESAGAASVHYLTLSPLAQGLFHKAICQSGVATNPWAIDTKNSRKNAFNLAAALGCESTDPLTVVEFLRTIDTQKLIEADIKILPKEQNYMHFGMFVPTIDDKSPNPFLPKHPSILMKAGVRMPLLIGHNTNEGSMFQGPFQGKNPEEAISKLNTNIDPIFHSELENVMKTDGVSAMDLKRMYFGSGPLHVNMLAEYAHFIGDTLFHRNIYEVLKVQQEKHNDTTYFYKFAYDAPDTLTKQRFNIKLPGTTHAEELQYLFYPYLFKSFGISLSDLGEEKLKVVDYFSQMWTDFAKTGKPTPETTDLIPVIWQPLQKGKVFNYMSINSLLSMETTKQEEHTFEWNVMKNKL